MINIQDPKTNADIDVHELAGTNYSSTSETSSSSSSSNALPNQVRSLCKTRYIYN